MSDWHTTPRPVMLTFEHMGIIHDALTRFVLASTTEAQRNERENTLGWLMLQNRQWFENPDNEQST